MATTIEEYNLLVIDDDNSEQKLIKMLVHNSGYSFKIKFLSDGEDAINFIDAYPAVEDFVGRIHLVFMDLNLPKVNGIEVLKSIKKNELLRKVPVIVLTTSNSKNDINLAYEAGASGFIRKPSDIDQYEKTIKLVFDYWFNICLTP